MGTDLIKYAFEKKITVVGVENRQHGEGAVTGEPIQEAILVARLRNCELNDGRDEEKWMNLREIQEVNGQDLVMNGTQRSECQEQRMMHRFLACRSGCFLLPVAPECAEEVKEDFVFLTV